MITPTSMSLIAAILLAAVYLLGHRLLPKEERQLRRRLSIAAGASMAYIFLDVMPELAEHHHAFLTAVGRELLFARQRVYAVGLMGFVALYALKKLVLAARGGAHSTAVFRIHIAGFTLYGWVIGDVLVSRVEAGAVGLWLYVLAMAFHLAVVSSSLAKEDGVHYQRGGRWVLAASILVGWLTAELMPLSEVTMARLFAFVAGGVIMTSANEELHREKEGRLGWFALGACGYGALLLLA